MISVANYTACVLLYYLKYYLIAEEKLIEQVRLHEVLFDYKSATYIYRDQHVRQAKHGKMSEGN